jgi:hypothetical protein
MKLAVRWPKRQQAQPSEDRSDVTVKDHKFAIRYSAIKAQNSLLFLCILLLSVDKICRTPLSAL